MSKRRKPWNWFRIIFLGVLVASAVYVNQFIVPTVQPIGIPTATPTRDPESFISEAEKFFKQGKLNQAIDAYTQVVRARPKDSAAYIAMARMQVWAGKYVEAQTSAENAILINPTNSNAHAVRGWALDFQKDYVEATASIKKALEIDPNNALAYAYYAELLMDQDAANVGPLDVLQKASDASKKALELDPALLEAHRARGYVYYLTGGGENMTHAITEYQQAILINPNLEDLQLGLGLSYLAVEANEDATTAFTQANTLNPSDPLPNLYISRIQAKLGNFKRAIQYAESAVNAEPANANYHGNLGVVLYRDSQYAEAMNELRYVVKGGTLKDGTVVTPIPLDPSLRIADYYFRYGMALTKTEPPQCGEAILIAQQMLDKLRDNPDYVFNAGEIIRVCTETTPVPGASETPGGPSAGRTPTVTPTP